MNDMVRVENSFADVPEDELLRYIVAGLQQIGVMAAPFIYEIALRWAELKRRGSQHVAILQKSADRFCFDAVAARRLDPAIPARMAAMSGAVKMVAMLTMDEQRKLADMPFVKVAKMGKDGVEVVDVPVERLSRAECLTLIDGDAGLLRDPEAQMALVKPKRETQHRECKRTLKYRLTEEQEVKFRTKLAIFNQKHSRNLSPEGMVQRLLQDAGFI